VLYTINTPVILLKLNKVDVLKSTSYSELEFQIAKVLLPQNLKPNVSPQTKLILSTSDAMLVISVWT
jgi:hypothetical protein